jgi:protein KTI12
VVFDIEARRKTRLRRLRAAKTTSATASSVLRVRKTFGAIAPMAPPPPSGCLVLLCGHPASGKSTAAAEISRRIQAAGARVLLVDEPSLHLPRNASYRDARSEKNTRGLLKATVERAVHRDGPVVLLDANNGIKGYRYELWCIARQAGTRFCVVHCETPVEEARMRNAARRDRGGGVGGGEEATFPAATKNFSTSSSTSADAEWGGYDAAIFDDLVFRFERPDGKNRWDAPLFVLKPSERLESRTGAGSGEDASNDEKKAAEDDAARREAAAGFPKRESLDGYGAEHDSRDAVLERAVCSMLGVPDRNAVNGKAARNGVDAFTTNASDAKDVARNLSSGVLRAVKRSASTQPTTKPSDASVRSDVDAGAQDIIDFIMKRDAENGGAGGSVTGGRAQYEFESLQSETNRGLVLRCARAPSLQTLRRLKRSFLRSAATAAAGAASPRDAARRLFVEHVQRDADLGAW